MSEKSARNSNIEVLRIVLMLLIVMLHFCKHSTIGDTSNSLCYLFYCFVLALGTCAVNCFVMISGYYGIKFSTHKFLKLWIQLFAWNFVIVFWGGEAEIFELSLSILLKAIMPFSQNVWWFATNYLILMMLSPFINRLEKNLSDGQLTALVGILLVCFTIIPMISENPVLDTYGYDIVIFTLCYLIGGRLHRSKEFFNKVRIVAPALFVICVFIMFAIPYFVRNTRIIWYNSPIAVLAAIALFITFINIKIGKIKLINNIAQSTFAVYLISDHPVVRNWLYGFLPINSNIDETAVIPYVLLFSLVVFIVCIIAEKIRTMFFNRLEEKMLGKVINKLRLDMFERIISNEIN